MYATRRPLVQRGPVLTYRSVDQRNNDVLIIAERDYAVGFDDKPWVAVQVTTT
jgi:hypothetical protein